MTTQGSGVVSLNNALLQLSIVTNPDLSPAAKDTILEGEA